MDGAWEQERIFKKNRNKNYGYSVELIMRKACLENLDTNKVYEGTQAVIVNLLVKPWFTTADGVR